MSTLHNTSARLLAWIQRHGLVLVAGAVVFALAVMVFVTTLRLYDERQAKVQALQEVTVDGCIRGNELRAALRDYVAQTIVIRPVPPGLSPAATAEAEERNAAAKAALDRSERTFAARDCDALARTLQNP